MPAHDFDLSKANRARVGALLADLGVGLTLAQLALKARPGSEKRQRNTTNARKAYDSIVRWRDGLIFTEAEASQIKDRLAKLKSTLEQLGESF